MSQNGANWSINEVWLDCCLLSLSLFFSADLPTVSSVIWSSSQFFSSKRSWSCSNNSIFSPSQSNSSSYLPTGAEDDPLFFLYMFLGGMISFSNSIGCFGLFNFTNLALNFFRSSIKLILSQKLNNLQSHQEHL